MLGRLSYEPSLQAVFTDTLPAATVVVGDPATLRQRVSWPLMARATGLGEIQGGEIVLVPAGRADRIVPSASALASSGLAGLVIASDFSEAERETIRLSGLPAALVPTSTDLRRVREEMERYIIRRRRELFERGQDFHRALVEAAIGGLGVEELLTRAERKAGKPALLDREGDVLQGAGPPRVPSDPPPDSLLAQIRIACHGQVTDCVSIAGPPRTLALPVFAGRERRGIVVLLDVGEASLDEDEVLLNTLASACAIALGREPVLGAPSLHDLLSSGSRVQGAEQLRRDSSTWIALALRDATMALSRIERAVSSELQARVESFVLARHDDVLLALIDTPASLNWESIVRALQVRLGSTDLRGGAGRRYRAVSGAERTANEALEALARSGQELVTRFETVELEVLLEGISGWQEFAQGRLGPLLDAGTSRQELLETLRVYLATGMNATESARRLQVHRNTLLYRVQRIQELLEVSLDNSEEVFGLDLALRILAVHRAMSQ